MSIEEVEGGVFFSSLLTIRRLSALFFFAIACLPHGGVTTGSSLAEGD